MANGSPWMTSLGGRLAILLAGFIVLATVGVVAREYRVGQERLVAETHRALESVVDVAAERLTASLRQRERLARLWAEMETSQDLAVDDIDKRVAESLAELAATLGGGTEAAAVDVRGARVLAASDPGRLDPATRTPLPGWVRATLGTVPAGVHLRSDGVVATADVRSRVDATPLGRIVLWTPLPAFLRAELPLDLSTTRLEDEEDHVLYRGDALDDDPSAWLWGTRTAATAAGPLRISTGRARADVVRALAASGRQLLTLAALFLLLALPAALLVSRSATSSLGRLTVAARELDAQRPGPLPTPSRWAPAEVRVLADAMGQMLERLEGARAELARTESLAAMGVLTKSLAHEIRTPLSVLKAGTEMLDRSAGTGPREREVTQMLQAEVGRLARLADDLLVFGRPSTPAPRAVDLEGVASAALAVLASDAEEKGVRLALSGGPTPAHADPDLLRQVVVNLVSNAIRACSAGGSVTVHVTSDPAGARLVVEDDGAGIAPDRLDEIWKPLVTTHRAGSGLGLPIVRQLVEAHGGRVEVRSTLGRGTRMIVTLPHEGTNA